MPIVETDVIVKQLAEFCAKYPTRNKAAKALKVTAAQLSQTLNKKNNVIPERILKRLGYKSQLVYSTIAPKKPRDKKPPGKVTKRAVSKSPALAAPYGGTASLPSNQGDDAYKAAAAQIYKDTAPKKVTTVASHPTVIDITAND